MGDLGPLVTDALPPHYPEESPNSLLTNLPESPAVALGPLLCQSDHWEGHQWLSLCSKLCFPPALDAII